MALEKYIDEEVRFFKYDRELIAEVASKARQQDALKAKQPENIIEENYLGEYLASLQPRTIAWTLDGYMAFIQNIHSLILFSKIQEFFIQPQPCWI